jgi:site-specific DNA recombinase
MKLVIEGPGPSAPIPDPVLLKEIKRAHRCFDALVSGRIGSVAELAIIEGISDRYLSSLLPLAFLAPQIIEAIASGNQPADLTAHRLIRRLQLPIEWTAQKQLLGFV